MKNNTYIKIIKPTLDLIFAIIVLIIIWLPMLIIAICIKLEDGGKILFRQQRPGKAEKVFTLIKFRTMTENPDLENKTEHDMARMTKVGKLLRKTSMDELPQMINILKGDMSFIGPRPLLIEYLDYYSKEQSKRHLVKPGMSGLAQVSGRNRSSWETRLASDIEYIKKISFRLDCKIALKTIKNILIVKDINSEGNCTMSRFDDYVKNK